MSYDVASQHGKSSNLLSGPPATITESMRSGARLWIADYAIRHGLTEEETVDLIGMLGVRGDEMLPALSKERKRIA